jgi:hypothetical protein
MKIEFLDKGFKNNEHNICHNTWTFENGENKGELFKNTVSFQPLNKIRKLYFRISL